MDCFAYLDTNDISADKHEITHRMEQHVSAGRSVCIINYYNEFPVLSVSKLSRIDDGKFLIDLPDFHLNVISEKNTTIITLDRTTVLAECSNLNYGKGTALVYGFRYIELLADMREAFRIRPHNNTTVWVDAGGEKHCARLVDISATGCRISLPENHCLSHETVLLDLVLFDSAIGYDFRRQVAASPLRSYCLDGITYHCLEFRIPQKDQDKLIGYLNRHLSSIMGKLKNPVRVRR